MSIEITEIKRSFRYNGIALPDVPGLEPKEVRDLYSAQYPELVSAEVEAGEVTNGTQEFTFRKAVGVKGGRPRKGERLASLAARVSIEADGDCGTHPQWVQALERPSVRACAQAWSGFAQARRQHHGHERADARITATSDMLAPLP